jgi:hypothetical protein
MLTISPLNPKIPSPTLVGFFVCGMSGRFGCEKDIITVSNIISDLLGL